LGSRTLRFIFMDEAGISDAPQETVRIVAGIIVDADSQLTVAETAMKELLRTVPKQFQAKFVFSAKDVWNNPQYRGVWSQTDRLRLLKNIMSLPHRLGLPIAYGRINRGQEPHEGLSGLGMTGNQQEHFHAFTGCIAQADKWIRQFARVGEIGTVVAEEPAGMKKWLKFSTRMFKTAMHFEKVAWTEQDKAQGYCSQETDMLITRTRGTVHFVDKADEPVIWIADACAYGMRRFHEKQSFGDEMMAAVHGRPVSHGEYPSSTSFGFF